jgi:hypothetical protein
MIKLTTGQSHTNNSLKDQIVNIKYLNCFDEYQTDQKLLEPGQTFTKTQNTSIVFIEQLT